jgi:hypothetical protein
LIARVVRTGIAAVSGTLIASALLALAVAAADVFVTGRGRHIGDAAVLAILAVEIVVLAGCVVIGVACAVGLARRQRGSEIGAAVSSALLSFIPAGLAFGAISLINTCQFGNSRDC